MSKFIVSGAIFEKQIFGGISRLWASLCAEFHRQSVDFEIDVLHEKITTRYPIPQGRISKTKIQRLFGTYILIGHPSKKYFLSHWQICLFSSLTVVVCHDLMNEKKLPKWHPKILFQKLVYSKAHRIIAISEKTYDEFKIYYPNLVSKIRIIENPLMIDYEKGNKFYTKNDEPRKLTGVYIGLREGDKNFASVLQFFSMYPDTVLNVIGSFPTEKEEQRYASLIKSQNLLFRGPLSETALHAAIKSADFLYMPSKDEGFGLPVIEALALQTPVVIENPSVFYWLPARWLVDLTKNYSQGELTREIHEFKKRSLEISKEVNQRFNLERCAKEYLNCIAE